ncbi:hypothetical protein [Dactylosporangium sp. NPDC000521]|uniref:nSTAND1 domain-containing NTPase n=1 Tax=Dactylosporangium sp. NPDC000521 TaxID=3363975 RepID=UPI0036BF5552
MEPVDAESPYRGLTSYGIDDAAVYFGRAELTRTILQLAAARVYRPGPLVLVGPSGSGKSSLLRAGLLSGVRRGELEVPGSARWPWAVVTPGADPLTALARPLGPLLATAISEVAAKLRTAPRHTARRLGEALSAGGPLPSRMLLVVDQFEEMFTLCADAAARRAFVLALRALSDPAPDGTDPPTLLVVSVRADFYARCTAYSWLADALRDSQVLVTPMTREQLREVVVRPAETAGLRLERGLTEVVLRDAGAVGGEGTGEVGVLPLLSHAMLGTWQARRGNLLTVEGYQSTGGIGGAIAQTAESLYGSLLESERADLRRLLLRMVAVTDGALPARNRVPRADVADHRLLDRLIELRLVTASDAYVEIAHEALIREWVRLDAWIREDGADLALRRQLGAAANAWNAEGRHDAALYAGPRLAGARHRVEDPRLGQELTALERDFLKASIRLSRRRIRRLYTVIVGLATAVLVVVGAAGYALQQRQTVRDQRAAATLQALLSTQALLRGTDSRTALQLGVAALRLGGGQPALQSLRTTLTGPHYAGGFTAPVQAFDPDSATALVKPELTEPSQTWNLADPVHPQVVAPSTCSDPEDAVAIGPGGHLIAYFQGAEPRLVPTQVETLKIGAEELVVCELGRPGAPPLSATRIDGVRELNFRYGFAAENATFSPDGRWIAAAHSYGGPLTLVDVAGRSAFRLQLPKALDSAGMFAAAAFSPDGTTLAALYDEGGLSAIVDDSFLVVYDVSRPGTPALTATIKIATGSRATGAYSVAFQPASRTVAVGADHVVQLWNLDEPKRPVQLAALSGGARTFRTVAFNANGTLLAAGTDTGEVQIWSVRPPATMVPLGSVTATSAEFVRFATDGRTVIASGRNGTTLVDVGVPNLLARLDRPGPIARPPVFNHDGSLLVSVDGARFGDDTTIAVWRVADPARPVLVAAPRTGVAEVHAVAFAPDDHRILVAGESAALWDLTDPARPTQTAAWPIPEGPVYAAAFSPSGTLLATSTVEGLRLWRMQQNAAPVAMADVPGPDDDIVKLLTFRRDGQSLLAVSDVESTVWDVRRPRSPKSRMQVLTRTAHFEYHAITPLIGKAVSTDGEVLAMSYPNGFTDLWQLDRSKPTEPFDSMRLDTAVQAPATLFTAGNVFLQAAEDDTLTVWDARGTTTPARVLTVDTPASVNAMALSPDQHTLATADNGGIWLWNVAGVLTAIQDPIAMACEFTGATMPGELWAKYAPGVSPIPLCG